MGEFLRESTPEWSPADSRKWIGRIVIAVVLGEAIWGLLVSITNDLILPAAAKVTGGDNQTFLHTRTGDFNVPDLLASVLQLSLAVIVAALLYSWSQQTGRVQSTPLHLAPVAAPSPTPVVAPDANTLENPAADTAIQGEAPVTKLPPPQLALSRQVNQPAKPKAPKVVHYNIVGEPVDDDE